MRKKGKRKIKTRKMSVDQVSVAGTLNRFTYNVKGQEPQVFTELLIAGGTGAAEEWVEVFNPGTVLHGLPPPPTQDAARAILQAAINLDYSDEDVATMQSHFDARGYNIGGDEVRCNGRIAVDSGVTLLPGEEFQTVQGTVNSATSRPASRSGCPGRDVAYSAVRRPGC